MPVGAGFQPDASPRRFSRQNKNIKEKSPASVEDLAKRLTWSPQPLLLLKLRFAHGRNHAGSKERSARSTELGPMAPAGQRLFRCCRGGNARKRVPGGSRGPQAQGTVTTTSSESSLSFPL